MVVAAGAAQPIEGQDLTLRLHGGIIQPVGATADYFKLGPSVALEALLPLSDKLGVTGELGWDYLNTTAIYPTPTTNLWRTRVGVEAGLMGDEDGFQVKALAGAGMTFVKSHNFWLESRRPYTFEGETINENALNAVGGIRLGYSTSEDIRWWLTGKLNWQPIAEENQDALRELAREELDPLGSSMLLAITLGVNLW
jgi:hypothetical protein